MSAEEDASGGRTRGSSARPRDPIAAEYAAMHGDDDDDGGRQSHTGSPVRRSPRMVVRGAGGSTTGPTGDEGGGATTAGTASRPGGSGPRRGGGGSSALGGTGRSGTLGVAALQARRNLWGDVKQIGESGDQRRIHGVDVRELGHKQASIILDMQRNRDRNNTPGGEILKAVVPSTTLGATLVRCHYNIIRWAVDDVSTGLVECWHCGKVQNWVATSQGNSNLPNHLKICKGCPQPYAKFRLRDREFTIISNIHRLTVILFDALLF